MTTEQILGENIAKRRKLKGDSQDAMGKVTGSDQATISRIERGERLPTPEQASLISQYFDGALSELHLLIPAKYPAPPVSEAA